MMKLAFSLSILLAAAGPAFAKDPVFVEAKAVKDKPTIVIAPDRAYILVRADGQTSFMLFKDPSAEDQAEYDRLRTEAFDEEQERHAKKLARYERDMAIYAKTPKANRGVRPEKPVELTRDNFAFTPFPLLAQVGIGPLNRLSNDKGNSVYLMEVTPGSYRLYGPVSAGAQGAMAGICFCLGSVRFDAKPGEIVDMGRAVVSPMVKPAAGDSSSPVVAANGSYSIEPPSADMPVDPRLAGMAIRPAVYRPAGKLPNFFGLPISRLQPMPGVFAYDRDRIVDLTAQAASGGK